MSDILTAEAVEAVFHTCMFNEGEDTAGYVKAEGISCDVGFHPGRLEEGREVIESMLSELPLEFHESSGGGMSFLNACNDKDGKLWTGLHQRMEQLFQLGIGIGRVKCLMPKDMWSALPGGMPYYVVTTAPAEGKEAPPLASTLL